MKTILKTTPIAAAATTALLTLLSGCSQNVDPTNGDEATGHDEIVGVTNLTPLESMLGLTRGQAAQSSESTLRAGVCHRALMGLSYPEIEFRRYDNGAVFFGKKDSAMNTGDKRPVLCVDIHSGSFEGAYSGIVLDAMFRYDLGALEQVSHPGHLQKTLHFTRGDIQLSSAMHWDECLAALRSRPFELPIDKAHSASGVLEQITLKSVTMSNRYSAPQTRDITIDGELAAFVYRVAFRKAEDANEFALETDAVGTFDHTGWEFGDGGDAATQINFTNGNASDVDNWVMLGERMQRYVFRKKDAASNTAPVAECGRSEKQDVAPGAFTCTGL